jgi:hypothetical protein
VVPRRHTFRVAVHRSEQSLRGAAPQRLPRRQR